MPDALLKNWRKKSSERFKLYKHFLSRTHKNQLHHKLADLHDEAFERVDCLTCAECCKNYSPRFKTPDIKRISKVLSMKESNFIESYLKIDDEGDYVLQSTPCAFLESNNRCSIYEHRPSDCRRFPYTDEDVFVKRQQLTLKNITFCPAAYYVIERLMEEVQ